MISVTFIAGIIGFIIIEGYSFVEALYMTVITISTVGFSEVKPLSESGRIFTVLIIIFNLGVFTFALSQLTALILDGEYIQYRKARKMKEKIKEKKY